MIIQIRGGSNRGWRQYVTYGTKRKPRDISKVKVIKGDLIQGDRIENLTNYKENSYLIVLSFKGRINDKTIRNTVNEFEHHFMMGFEQDEYHLDAVWHQDTDDDHVHIRIPKMNLKTQTQLQLYYDKKDRKRINAIRDYLDAKYQLESPLDNRLLIKENKDFYLDNWRKKFGDKDFDFTTKKSKSKVENSITQAVHEMHQAELLSSFEDVQSFIEEQGVKIIKIGYDIPQDFHYFTIENTSGKMRIKGEVYNEKFWDDSREVRAKQINFNKRDNAMGREKHRGLEELKRNLIQCDFRRKKEVNRQYKSARDRAEKRVGKRQSTNIGKDKSSRKKRSPFFTLKPYPVGYINSTYKFYSIQISKKKLEYTSEVSKRAQRKTIRSDTQDRFIRDQRQKSSLFHTEGGLDERIVRRRLNKIRGKRKSYREREIKLFEQIRVSNIRVSESLRSAEQESFNSVTATRRSMEEGIARDTRRLNEKVIKSVINNKSYTRTIRELFTRINERITNITQSIKGVMNEMKIKKHAVSHKRSKTRLKPWS